MDPIAAALCGAGAALLATFAFVWGAPSFFGHSPVDYLVLGGAFYGIFRATRSRVALGLVGALLVAWFLNHFWIFVPEKLLGTGYEGSNAEHHDAPAWWGDVVLMGALLVSVVIARAKLGWGLTALVVGAFAVALLAQLASTVLAFHGMGDPGLVRSVADGSASGWRAVALALAATAWTVLGLGPPSGQAISRRVTPVLGAVGALLIAATLWADGRSAALVPLLATMLAAWVLSAIGLGGLAGAGAGAPAWAGMGLVIAQLVVGFPVGFVVFDKMMNEHFPDVVSTVMPLGLVGFGIAVLAARALPLGGVRGLIGVCFLVGAFGAMLTLLTVLSAPRLRDPFWPLQELMRPATAWAMTLWASYLVFVAVPPKTATA